MSDDVDDAKEPSQLFELEMRVTVRATSFEDATRRLKRALKLIPEAYSGIECVELTNDPVDRRSQRDPGQPV